MIFRKLFHTGLYEEIKNEFAVRKKEKQAEDTGYPLPVFLA